MTRNKNKKNKGNSLIEILIAMTIFMLLIIFVFYIADFTKSHLDETIKATVVQADLRTAQRDIYKYISNSTWGMFTNTIPPSLQGIYYYDTDYRHALFLQSSLKDNGTTNFDDSMEPNVTKYVLYYIIRPPGDRCVFDDPTGTLDSADPRNDPDIYCPHKRLVKKEIKSDVIFGFPTSTDFLEKYLTYDLSDTSSGEVLSARILAENVLDFTVIPPENTGVHTIYYNGAAQSVDNIALLIRLTSLKEKKYMNIEYHNGSHLDNTANLFTLEGLAEPKN